MNHINSWNLAAFIGFWITVCGFFGSIGAIIAAPILWRKLRRR